MPERTGHNKKTGYVRSEQDYFATHPDLCRLVVQAVKSKLGINPKTILEPGCGAGTWMEPLHEAWPEAQLQAIEINEALAEYTRARGFSVRTGDLLNNSIGDWDLIIGNPPFYCLDDLMPILLDHLKPGGHLVLLLRTNFTGGQERFAQLWSKHRPAHIWALPARPGFTADGSTDATDYSIYVFTALPTPPGETRFDWLDNRLISNRWAGKKEQPDPNFPDPRKGDWLEKLRRERAHDIKVNT